MTARGQFRARPGDAPGNKGRKYPAEPLTSDEVAAIIGQCSRTAPTGIRNRAMLTLLYRSGLRVSEVLALRPSDVNLAKHSLRLLDTKSGKAQTRGFHPAPMAPWRAGWTPARPCPALGHAPGSFALSRRPGVRRLRARPPAPPGRQGRREKRVTPHQLRHRFAVELEAAGTPVTTISKLLGHSSVAVTSRYLDHLTNAQAVSALEAVDLPAVE